MSRNDRKRLVGRIALWLVGVAVLAGLGFIAVTVSADPPGRHYQLLNSVVTADADHSGSARFTEQITFGFHGTYHGAYREIPLRTGEAISNITVSEGGTAYAPGASAELGSAGYPGSFGVDTSNPSYVRIVWHFEATDVPRTFTITYDGRGALGKGPGYSLAEFKPWGSSFLYPLDALDATLLMPAGVTPGQVKAFVHLESVGGPASVIVDKAPDGRTRVHAHATDIPAHSGVEVLADGPDSAVENDAKLPHVKTSEAALLAREKKTRAAQDRKIADLKDAHRHVIARTIPWVVVASLLALAWVWLAFVLFGRERKIAGVPERVSEPPTTLPPLLAASLTAQQDQPRGEGLGATIFDLVRRKYYTTLPATSGRNGEVVDIALKIPANRPSDGLTGSEQAVLDLLDPIIPEEGLATGDIAAELKQHVTTARSRFEAYKKAATSEVASQSWHTSGVTAGIFLIIPAAIIALIIFGTISGLPELPSLERARDVGRCVAGGSAILILGLALLERRMLVRRRSGSAELGAQWDAFRRYLEEYGHLKDAEPASLPLWEKYLVYGIAFGCAAEIAREFAKSGVLTSTDGQQSPFYGMNSLAFNYWAFSSLGNSIGTAAAPAQTSSSAGWSGGGGGFGGGGGGFGGGGGGAW